MGGVRDRATCATAPQIEADRRNPSRAPARGRPPIPDFGGETDCVRRRACPGGAPNPQHHHLRHRRRLTNALQWSPQAGADAGSGGLGPKGGGARQPCRPDRPRARNNREKSCAHPLTRFSGRVTARYGARRSLRRSGNDFTAVDAAAPDERPGGRRFAAAEDSEKSVILNPIVYLRV